MCDIELCNNTLESGGDRIPSSDGIRTNGSWDALESGGDRILSRDGIRTKGSWDSLESAEDRILNSDEIRINGSWNNTTPKVGNIKDLKAVEDFISTDEYTFKIYEQNCAAMVELSKLNKEIDLLATGRCPDEGAVSSSSCSDENHPDPDDEGTASYSWMNRCLALEDCLTKFRGQASHIRDLLQTKLMELEGRVREAELRAVEADEKVQIVERRLEESNWIQNNQGEENLQIEMMEKDKTIKCLESEVESQRQQRLSDAKQVEAKAARIKDWVTNKLRELEQQNTHLRQQNEYCNQQMELLRNQLERMQSMEHRRTRDSTSTEDCSFGSSGGRSEESLGGFNSKSRKSRNLASSAIDPLYAEVDSRVRERRREVRAQRTRSAEARVSSKASGSSVSLRSRNSRLGSLSTDLAPSTAMEEECPKSPLEALDEALDAVMPSSFSLPIAPPRSRNRSGDLPSGNSKSLGQMEDEYGDYSEIFTPTDPRERSDIPMLSAMSVNEPMSGCSSVRSVSGMSQYGCTVDPRLSTTGPPPPPPPLHKVPSWEDRIYKTASAQVRTGAALDCSNNNLSTTPHLPHIFSSDVSVPIYAAIKGKASQMSIRQVTGDTSDSSDGEKETPADSEKTSGAAVRPAVEVQAESMKKDRARGRKPVSEERSKRDISIESDMSGDYALPADEPNQILRSSFLESPRRSGEKNLEKCGYLSKLGGKLKSWQKRYFQLKDSTLAYWKSHHDLERKPQGVILISESCRVSRAEGSSTFQIEVEDRIHYLTADNLSIAEEWVKILQSIIQRDALRILLSREDQSPTLKGWLTKVKHGHSKRCWCVLLGNLFVYFRTPSDQNPLGQINMRDSRVEEVEHISDSDSDDTEEQQSPGSLPTVGIFPNHVHQGPTYLIFPSKSEQEEWLYELTVVSGGDPKVGTQFEQLLQKLMESGGDAGNILWRHPMMGHSKEPPTSPLTTFTSEPLQAEALKLFKIVQLFSSVVLDSSGIDYHVVLVQNAIQQCLTVPQLQPELLAILAKQTTKQHSNRHGVQSFLMNATNLFSCDSVTAGSSSSQTPSKSLLPATTYIQCWMMLSLVVSIFLPRNNKLLWFLRTHFNRHKDSKSETGKYAAYCSKALERCVTNGARVAKPSRLEVLSILLKNPHHHSLPHSVPVHLLNNTYQVVGFDGSTTMEEFSNTLTQQIGCRTISQSGFSIFSDDPLNPDIHHSLAKHEKVCDVLSGWETALRERGSGKFQNKRAIKFTFRNRLHLKRNLALETDKEKLLLCYQVCDEIVADRFPVNKELAFELSALMSQIEYGDVSTESGRAEGQISTALTRFFPSRYRTDKQDGQTLLNRWSQLSGKSTSDCVRIMLTCTRKWQFFGAYLFHVQQLPEEVEDWCDGEDAREDAGNLGEPAYLAVGEEGISVLHPTSLQLNHHYPYSSIVSFGGCGQDFMLVVVEKSSNKPVKLIFSTNKIKILELTVLIADYMNILGQALPSSRPKSRSVSRSRPSAPTTPRQRKERSLGRSGSSASQLERKRKTEKKK